jgi:hypothetical protein
MRLFERSRESPTEVDDLFKRVERLAAVVSRIETEWADTKDQVRRSYQRLEKAGQKIGRVEPPLPPAPELELPPRANLDPFSKKLLEVRSATNADASGTHESTG